MASPVPNTRRSINNQDSHEVSNDQNNSGSVATDQNDEDTALSNQMTPIKEDEEETEKNDHDGKSQHTHYGNFVHPNLHKAASAVEEEE